MITWLFLTIAPKRAPSRIVRTYVIEILTLWLRFSSFLVYCKKIGRDAMTQNTKPQWQPIEKLSLIASIVDGMLEATTKQYGTLQKAKQKPYSLDDALVNRAVKVYTDQKNDLWVYDKQLNRWKAQKLTSAQS